MNTPTLNDKLFFMKVILHPKNACRPLDNWDKKVGVSIINDLKKLPKMDKEIKEINKQLDLLS